MQRHFGQIWTTTLLRLSKPKWIRKRYFFCSDRFELPHRFKSNAKLKYKIAPSFQWTDPNYRKPNTDLLKTKKKPSAYIAKCLSAERLAFLFAERMITDECNYFKRRLYRLRSAPRRKKTVGRCSLVFGYRSPYQLVGQNERNQYRKQQRIKRYPSLRTFIWHSFWTTK